MAGILDFISAKSPEEAKALWDEGVVGDALKDLATGAARGLTVDALGAPVDIVNTLLEATGLPVSDEPVGGSKHIRKLASQPKEDNPQELAGNLLSALINPSTASAKMLPLLGGIFMGPKSKIFDKGLAKSFLEMEGTRAPADKTFQTTNTYRGALDRKLRQEISDLPAELQADLIEIQRQGIPISLGKLLKHPELFEAYPQMADYSVIVRKGRGGSFNPETKQITLGLGKSPEDALGTLLHEIQHGVQEIEDFVPGGNPSQMRLSQQYSKALEKASPTDKRNPDFLKSLAEDLYNRLGGEVESRNATLRWLFEKMAPGSTYGETHPWVTQEIYNSKQLWPPK